MKRGTNETTSTLFSHVPLRPRVPTAHPLRKIRQIVIDTLASPDAGLLQLPVAIRSERQLMGHMGCNRLFWCVVGPGFDHPIGGEGRPGTGPVDRFQP